MVDVTRADAWTLRASAPSTQSIFTGVAVDGAGRLHVVDSTLRRVLRLRDDGKFEPVHVDLPAVSDTRTGALDIEADGTLVVKLTGSPRLLESTADGWRDRLTSEPAGDTYTDFALRGSDVWALGDIRDRLHRYTTAWAESALGTPAFDADGITADNLGLIVSDRSANPGQLWRLDLSGTRWTPLSSLPAAYAEVVDITTPKQGGSIWALVFLRAVSQVRGTPFSLGAIFNAALPNLAVAAMPGSFYDDGGTTDGGFRRTNAIRRGPPIEFVRIGGAGTVRPQIFTSATRWSFRVGDRTESWSGATQGSLGPLAVSSGFAADIEAAIAASSGETGVLRIETAPSRSEAVIELTHLVDLVPRPVMGEGGRVTPPNLSGDGIYERGWEEVWSDHTIAGFSAFFGPVWGVFRRPRAGHWTYIAPAVPEGSASFDNAMLVVRRGGARNDDRLGTAFDRWPFESYQLAGPDPNPSLVAAVNVAGNSSILAAGSGSNRLWRYTYDGVEPDFPQTGTWAPEGELPLTQDGFADPPAGMHVPDMAPAWTGRLLYLGQSGRIYARDIDDPSGWDLLLERPPGLERAFGVAVEPGAPLIRGIALDTPERGVAGDPEAEGILVAGQDEQDSPSYRLWRYAEGIWSTVGRLPRDVVELRGLELDLDGSPLLTYLRGGDTGSRLAKRWRRGTFSAVDYGPRPAGGGAGVQGPTIGAEYPNPAPDLPGHVDGVPIGDLVVFPDGGPNLSPPLIHMSARGAPVLDMRPSVPAGEAGKVDARVTDPVVLSATPDADGTAIFLSGSRIAVRGAIVIQPSGVILGSTSCQFQLADGRIEMFSRTVTWTLRIGGVTATWTGDEWNLVGPLQSNTTLVVPLTGAERTAVDAALRAQSPATFTIEGATHLFLTRPHADGEIRGPNLLVPPLNVGGVFTTIPLVGLPRPPTSGPDRIEPPNIAGLELEARASGRTPGVPFTMQIPVQTLDDGTPGRQPAFTHTRFPAGHGPPPDFWVDGGAAGREVWIQRTPPGLISPDSEAAVADVFRADIRWELTFGAGETYHRVSWSGAVQRALGAFPFGSLDADPADAIDTAADLTAAFESNWAAGGPMTIDIRVRPVEPNLAAPPLSTTSHPNAVPTSAQGFVTREVVESIDMFAIGVDAWRSAPLRADQHATDRETVVEFYASDRDPRYPLPGETAPLLFILAGAQGDGGFADRLLGIPFRIVALRGLVTQERRDGRLVTVAPDHGERDVVFWSRPQLAQRNGSFLRIIEDRPDSVTYPVLTLQFVTGELTTYETGLAGSAVAALAHHDMFAFPEGAPGAVTSGGDLAPSTEDTYSLTWQPYRPVDIEQAGDGIPAGAWGIAWSERDEALIAGFAGPVSEPRAWVVTPEGLYIFGVYVVAPDPVMGTTTIRRGWVRQALPPVAMPGGFVEDAAGARYLVDRASKKILRQSATGEAYEDWNDGYTVLSETPYGLAIAPDGDFWASDDSGSIVRQLGRTWGVESALPNGRDGAQLVGFGLTWDLAGRLLVATRDGIFRSPQAAGVTTPVFRMGLPPGETEPRGMVLDEAGNILLAARTRVWTRLDRRLFVDATGLPGDDDVNLGAPPIGDPPGLTYPDPPAVAARLPVRVGGTVGGAGRTFDVPVRITDGTGTRPRITINRSGTAWFRFSPHPDIFRADVRWSLTISGADPANWQGDDWTRVPASGQTIAMPISATARAALAQAYDDGGSIALTLAWPHPTTELAAGDDAISVDLAAPTFEVEVSGAAPLDVLPADAWERYVDADDGDLIGLPPGETEIRGIESSGDGLTVWGVATRRFWVLGDDGTWTAVGAPGVSQHGAPRELAIRPRFGTHLAIVDDGPRWVVNRRNEGIWTLYGRYPGTEARAIALANDLSGAVYLLTPRRVWRAMRPGGLAAWSVVLGIPDGIDATGLAFIPGGRILVSDASARELWTYDESLPEGERWFRSSDTSAVAPLGVLTTRGDYVYALEGSRMWRAFGLVAQFPRVQHGDLAVGTLMAEASSGLVETLALALEVALTRADAGFYFGTLPASHSTTTADVELAFFDFAATGDTILYGLDAIGHLDVTPAFAAPGVVRAARIVAPGEASYFRPAPAREGNPLGLWEYVEQPGGTDAPGDVAEWRLQLNDVSLREEVVPIEANLAAPTLFVGGVGTGGVGEVVVAEVEFVRTGSVTAFNATLPAALTSTGQDEAVWFRAIPTDGEVGRLYRGQADGRGDGPRASALGILSAALAGADRVEVRGLNDNLVWRSQAGSVVAYDFLNPQGRSTARITFRFIDMRAGDVFPPIGGAGRVDDALLEAPPLAHDVVPQRVVGKGGLVGDGVKLRRGPNLSNGPLANTSGTRIEVPHVEHYPALPNTEALLADSGEIGHVYAMGSNQRLPTRWTPDARPWRIDRFVIEGDTITVQANAQWPGWVADHAINWELRTRQGFDVAIWRGSDMIRVTAETFRVSHPDFRQHPTFSDVFRSLTIRWAYTGDVEPHTEEANLSPPPLVTAADPIEVAGGAGTVRHGNLAAPTLFVGGMTREIVRFHGNRSRASWPWFSVSIGSEYSIEGRTAATFDPQALTFRANNHRGEDTLVPLLQAAQYIEVQQTDGTVLWRSTTGTRGFAAVADIPPGLLDINVVFRDGAPGTSFPPVGGAGTVRHGDLAAVPLATPERGLSVEGGDGRVRPPELAAPSLAVLVPEPLPGIPLSVTLARQGTVYEQSAPTVLPRAYTASTAIARITRLDVGEFDIDIITPHGWHPRMLSSAVGWRLTGQAQEEVLTVRLTARDGQANVWDGTLPAAHASTDKDEPMVLDVRQRFPETVDAQLHLAVFDGRTTDGIRDGGDFRLARIHAVGTDGLEWRPTHDRTIDTWHLYDAGALETDLSVATAVAAWDLELVRRVPVTIAETTGEHLTELVPGHVTLPRDPGVAFDPAVNPTLALDFSDSRYELGSVDANLRGPYLAHGRTIAGYLLLQAVGGRGVITAAGNLAAPTLFAEATGAGGMVTDGGELQRSTHGIEYVPGASASATGTLLHVQHALVARFERYARGGDGLRSSFERYGLVLPDGLGIRLYDEVPSGNAAFFRLGEASIQHEVGSGLTVWRITQELEAHVDPVRGRATVLAMADVLERAFGPHHYPSPDAEPEEWLVGHDLQLTDDAGNPGRPPVVVTDIQPSSARIGYSEAGLTYQAVVTYEIVAEALDHG